MFAHGQMWTPKIKGYTQFTEGLMMIRFVIFLDKSNRNVCGKQSRSQRCGHITVGMLWIHYMLVTQ